MTIFTSNSGVIITPNDISRKVIQLKVEMFDIIMKQESLNNEFNQLQQAKMKKLNELNELLKNEKGNQPW